MARFSCLRRSAVLLLAVCCAFGSNAAQALDKPEFFGNSLRLVKASAVSCFEARVAYEHQRGNTAYRQMIYDFSIGMEPSSALDYRPARGCAEGLFHIGGKIAPPCVWDELQQAALQLLPWRQPANDETVIAAAKPADFAAQLAVDGTKHFTKSSLCGVHETGICLDGHSKCFAAYVIRYAPTNELVAPHTIHRAEEGEE